MLKNVFTWIIVVAVTLTLAFKVVTRPKHAPVPTHAAVIVAAPETPKTYTEFREAHEPPEPAPAPAKPEQPKAAVVHHREHTKSHPKTKPSRADVQPTSGGHTVGVPCGRLKAGLDKWGYGMVVAGAPAYGYSATDVDNAMKACGLSK